MASKGFIDIHCHSVMTHYRNKETGTPVCEEITKDVLPLVDIIMGKEGLRSYNTQSDFGKLAKNNAKAIIISLYPIERKWFLPKIQADVIKHPFIANITGFSVKNVRKMDNERPIQYYADLEGEYNYLLNQIKNECGNKNFEVVSSYSELEINMQKDNVVSIIISIEGASSIASDLPESYLEKPPSRVTLNDYNKYYRPNVFKLKGWGPNNDGSHAPLFIGMAHHFWNILAGHCESLPDILNQKAGKESGITPAGWQMINDLLSTKDINGIPNKTKRILIDVKHMSPKARKQYYSWLKQNNIQTPIFFSHAAIGDAPDLDCFIPGTTSFGTIDPKRNFFNTSSLSCNDEDIRKVVNTDGIIGIVLHEGRIAAKHAMKRKGYGINKMKRKVNQFEDQINSLQLKIQQSDSDNERRRLIKLINKILQKKLKTIEKIKNAYMSMIMANIYKVVDVTYKLDNSLQGKGWEFVCIGSDFDGMINKLDYLGTVNEFGELRERFVNFLKQPEALTGFNKDWSVNQLKFLQFGVEPEKLADMFFEENALNWLKKWW